MLSISCGGRAAPFVARSLHIAEGPRGAHPGSSVGVPAVFGCGCSACTLAFGRFACTARVSIAPLSQGRPSCVYIGASSGGPGGALLPMFGGIRRYPRRGVGGGPLFPILRAWLARGACWGGWPGALARGACQGHLLKGRAGARLFCKCPLQVSLASLLGKSPLLVPPVGLPCNRCGVGPVALAAPFWEPRTFRRLSRRGGGPGGCGIWAPL